MTLWGWIFLIVSWTAIITLMILNYSKILKSQDVDKKVDN